MNLHEEVLIFVLDSKHAQIMIAANYTEFRPGLKKFLDAVEQNNETLIIKRGSGKGRF